jgi:hypothetical protein
MQQTLHNKYWWLEHAVVADYRQHSAICFQLQQVAAVSDVAASNMLSQAYAVCGSCPPLRLLPN